MRVRPRPSALRSPVLDHAPADPAEDDAPLPVTILLVEDDPNILTGVAELIDLEQAAWGYAITILSARDGVDALPLLHGHTPDLIVSDISMPHMDGYELLEQVRSIPRLVHTPFIFLTARGSSADINRGQLSGVERYITKPFEAGDLLELIRIQLDLSIQRKQRRQEVAARVRNAIFLMFQHEFRTPTTFITAYTELLHDTLRTLHEDDLLAVQEFVQGIEVGSQRLMELTENLHKVVDLHTGAYLERVQPLARPLTDLSRLLRDVAAACAADCAESGISLTVDVADDLPPVLGHDDSVRTIGAVLLSNAVKFTRPKGSGQTIAFTAVAEDDCVRLTVRDSGLGFPNHVRHEIFDLFSQYNRDLHEQQGAGVGLTIARALVQMHRGRIQAWGEPGVGATFDVTLPVWQPGSDATLVQSDAYPPTATILIVEDAPTLLYGLEELLKLSQGAYLYQPLTAQNGREALDVLARNHVDLVLSDVLMPEMNGLELLRKVRQEARWIDIPFIFLTAFDDPQQAMKLGVDDFVPKPYSNEQLLSLIDTRLTRYFARRAVVDSDFDALKYNILGTLPPDFLPRLRAVTAQSEALLALLAHPDQLAAARPQVALLRQNSTAIKELVAEFTKLVEMFTGGFDTAFRIRAEVIRDFRALVETQLKRVLDSAESTPPVVDLHCPAETPAVYGDREALTDAMRRVMGHCLDQCSDHDRAHLTIEVQERDGWLRVVFSAEGLPLSPDHVARLQHLLALEEIDLSATAYPETRLIVARELLRLHAGRLLVMQSDANGSAVVIELPVHTGS